MISADRLQKALTYLAETDEPAARARALMLGLEKQEKTVLAMQYLKQDGTQGEKDAKARSTREYQIWRESYEQAVLDYELYRNKRTTEELIVEVWRSENANRRHGNVT